MEFLIKLFKSKSKKTTKPKTQPIIISVERATDENKLIVELKSV